ncbi:hypothetical protein EJB05_50408, partial [Eragrostis curvula]
MVPRLALAAEYSEAHGGRRQQVVTALCASASGLTEDGSPTSDRRVRPLQSTTFKIETMQMAIVSRKVAKLEVSAVGKKKVKNMKPPAVPQGRKLVDTMTDKWGDTFCYYFIENSLYAPRKLINRRVTITGKGYEVTPKKEEIPKKTCAVAKIGPKKSAPRKKEPKAALAKKVRKILSTRKISRCQHSTVGQSSSDKTA